MVVGKASTIGLAHPPLIFKGVKKCEICMTSFSTSFNFEPLVFEDAARCRTLKQTSCVVTRNDRLMSLPSLVKLSPRTLENRFSRARRKRAKSSISAVDYSISLKFCTEFKRMTSEVLSKFKRSKVKATAAWHDVSDVSA